MSQQIRAPGDGVQHVVRPKAVGAYAATRSPVAESLRVARAGLTVRRNGQVRFADQYEGEQGGGAPGSSACMRSRRPRRARRSETTPRPPG
jgi:hypothetical protein